MGEDERGDEVSEMSGGTSRGASDGVGPRTPPPPAPGTQSGPRLTAEEVGSGRGRVQIQMSQLYLH